MKNREYSNNRPTMSDAEIDKFKDFDGVMDKVNSPPAENPIKGEKPNFNFKQFLKYAKNIVVVTAAATIAIIGFNKWKSKASTNGATKDEVETPAENLSPAINPPLKGLETPFTTYRVNAQEDQEIVTSTGTRIQIFKNTFQDEEGNVLQGEVDVLFREYHDVVSIFTSGIPMEYDSAGLTYTFESAGMFDIQAEQGGEQVASFAKDIVVDVVSQNSSESFNDYYFDTMSREWKFIALSTIIDEEQPVPQEDSDIETGILLSEEKIATESIQAPKAVAEEVVKPIAPRSPKYPPLLSDKYAFEVDYDANEFSELTGNIVFQVDEKASVFSPIYYKVNWDVLKLSRSDQKDRYNLHLEKGEQKMDVVCFPAITMEEKNRLQAEYDRANKAYQDSLAVWNAYTATLVPQNIVGVGDGNHFLAPEEVELITQLTYRQVRVPRSGVYNCDQPIFARRYFGDQIKARFRSDDGSVSVSRNYVVDPRMNALFAARNGNTLLLDKRKNLIAWVWTNDHQLGIVNSEQLKDYDRSKTFDVELYSPKEGLEVIEDLLKG